MGVAILFSLVIMATCACAANGQLTLTGFPYVLFDTRNHKITCNYPGATSYTWTKPTGEVVPDAEHNMIVPGSQTDPEGLWQCDALVNGVNKTATANLFTYCNDVYEIDVTTTTPALGAAFTVTCKVFLNIAPGKAAGMSWQVTLAGDKSHKMVAGISGSKCIVNVEADNRICAPMCDISTGDVHFNLVINQVRASDMGYWRWYNSGANGCYSKVVLIGSAPDTGSFTLTGFPSALKGSPHTITCSYPGASSYAWKTPNGLTLNGGEQSLTSAGDFFGPEGVWQCNATVGGIFKTVKANLFVYCTGMYQTSVTNANPSMGSKVELKAKVTNPAGSSMDLYKFTPGTSMGTKVAYITQTTCVVPESNGNRHCAPATTCQTSNGAYYLNLTIDKARSSDTGYWRCKEYSKNYCYSKPFKVEVGGTPQPTTSTASAPPPTITTPGPVEPAITVSSDLSGPETTLHPAPVPFVVYKVAVPVAISLLVAIVLSVGAALRKKIEAKCCPNKANKVDPNNKVDPQTPKEVETQITIKHNYRE